MEKLLTLIVPSYNMEDYLGYCLESLLVGESLEQVEVLVINDGSKDGTSGIAHGFEAAFPGVFRVIDKENGNYGSCVNRGLDEATGKYVKVLDADDSFDTANFEKYLSFLSSVDADLILSDFAVVDSERTTRKVIRYDMHRGTEFDMDSTCTDPIFQNMQMHAVTYRLENLRRMGYRQTEGISYTDQQWIFIPMAAVKKVAYFASPVYRYLVGRAGQTVDPAVKMKSVRHTMKCAADMAAMYEKYRPAVGDRPVRQYLLSRVTPMLKDVYVFALSHYDEAMKSMLSEFDGQLKRISRELYDYIGSREASSFMGFEYLAWWRGHRDTGISVVRFFSSLYMIVLRLRKSSSDEDPMSVPVSF